LNESGNDYQSLVKRARRGDRTIDFRALRFAFLRARECDPDGDEEDLMAMRQAIQPRDYAKAVTAAEKLPMIH